MPKFIFRSDPDAQWTGVHKGQAFFAYAGDYLIDLNIAVVVDVEATHAPYDKLRSAQHAR